MGVPVAVSQAGLEFDSCMSRSVLEGYLARSITMARILQDDVCLEDNLRMLRHIGAKFLGRAFLEWGNECKLSDGMRKATAVAERIHAMDPQVILQAGIFENVTTEVGAIPVPDWVFSAFDREAEPRNFRLAAMEFEDGLYVNHWGPGASVPDITRLETRMWFFYLAASFINLGIESLHVGQISLIGRNDAGLQHWSELLTMIRDHAKLHARRHFVLCDAHVSSGVNCYGLTYDPTKEEGGFRVGDKLLLDFHALPMRIREVSGRPHEAELAAGHLDALYGRSMGGVTPSGWSCDHLPYLVEFDNWGSTGHGGTSVAGKIGDLQGIDDRFWIWGWDEICWLANQSEADRNAWLHYAWNWLKNNDRCGFLEMPGMRVLLDPVSNCQTYHANTQSAACPDGFNQEETIRAIWLQRP
jgi:hypothetical protein